MFAALCFAFCSIADLQNDARLTKPISLHDEIISLADLSAELGKKIGVPLLVRRRVADRKVTIVFKDRPAGEAMERLATCMFMSWQKSGTGYELDLTPQAASDETRTEAYEKELERGGLRDAAKEIRRLGALTIQGRSEEMTRLDKAYRDALKAGESPDSPKMQLLGSVASSLHSPGFTEVVGPALSAASYDEDGVPIGTAWFSSADRADPVGHFEPDSIPYRTGTNPYTDALVMVRYREDSHELETRLLGARGIETGVRTTAGSWYISVSNSKKKTELDRAMSEWVRAIPADIASKPVKAPDATLKPSEFGSGMIGRAQLLTDLADRSGVPVVADAFRRSLTKPIQFPDTSVTAWLESYAKVSKAPWRGRPDFTREEKGWLMFRADHWWWLLKPEIPESILGPLEAKATKDHSPLPFEDYARLAATLAPAQLSNLQRPETVLMRFPIGSLGSCAFSLRFYGECSSADRLKALSPDGVDLSAAGPQVQALAFEALIKMAFDIMEIPFVRSLLRGGADGLKGWKLFAEDENGHARDPSKIGDGREMRVSFTYGLTSRALSLQSFNCANSAP